MRIGINNNMRKHTHRITNIKSTVCSDELKAIKYFDPILFSDHFSI